VSSDRPGAVATLDSFRSDVAGFVQGLAADQGIELVDIAGLGADENLFETGAVDSLSMQALLARLEEMAGAHIELAAIDPESFFTIGGMYDFLVRPQHPARRLRPASG
jgi:hypothetical protein